MNEHEEVGYSLYIAWLAAIVATGGSLYFSEIRGFIPCELCWYQRILMYPLVILLGIACFRGDKHIIPYILPLSIIGGCFSIYHYSEQKFSAPSICTAGPVPCSGEYINWLGFITIPLMALTAFVIITVVLSISYKKTKNAIRQTSSEQG
ncbi:MAG TPA: disulfide oxidoreductase [Bacillales bacterium]|nr:disulfide oxidoreductase [Bacillales bacterium]